MSYGRVRAMLNHLGQRVTEAGPSTPVEIFGLSSVPEPGTAFTAVAEESKARQVAEFRRSKLREGDLQKSSRVSLEDLSERMLAGEVKELRVILKGDVNGSVEALADSLRALSTGRGQAGLDSSLGRRDFRNRRDVLRQRRNAIIIGFNVRPDPKAAQLAEKEGVDIRLYTIIYEAINEMREAMEGLLAPTYREKSLGRAEVRKTFIVQGNTVARRDGGRRQDCCATRARDWCATAAWSGKAKSVSLAPFQGRRARSQAGYECGIGLENFNDLKPGDVIEDFEMEAVLRKLANSATGIMRGQGGGRKTTPALTLRAGENAAGNHRRSCT